VQQFLIARVFQTWAGRDKIHSADDRQGDRIGMAKQLPLEPLAEPARIAASTDIRAFGSLSYTLWIMLVEIFRQSFFPQIRLIEITTFCVDSLYNSDV
jgi:hypothetical protein